jgi:enterochelin esterase-like enzyme
LAAAALAAFLPLLAACPFYAPPDVGTTTELAVAGPAGADYAVYVWLPEGWSAAGGPAPLASFYVLDGDEAFNGSARLVADAMAAGLVRPTAVIGVGYGDGSNERARDYLPSFADGQGGGFAAFGAWLAGALVPRLEAEFPLAGGRENRALGGHSFGGVAALNFLFAHADVFSAFAATSPSLWFDSNAAFADLDAYLAARRLEADPAPIRLLLTVGSQEGGGMDALHAAFADRLAAAAPAAFDLRSDVIAGKRHWNVRYAALGAYLGFLLGAPEADAPAAGSLQ